MTKTEKIIAITVHLIVPFMGILVYLVLLIKMHREKVEQAPILSLFLIFANYGVLFILLLTVFVWKWSAMASLGVLYLITAAPVIMAIIAFSTFKHRKLSKYHEWTFKAGYLYFVILPLLYAVFTIFDFKTLY